MDTTWRHRSGANWNVVNNIETTRYERSLLCKESEREPFFSDIVNCTLDEAEMSNLRHRYHVICWRQWETLFIKQISASVETKYTQSSVNGCIGLLLLLMAHVEKQAAESNRSQLSVHWWFKLQSLSTDHNRDRNCRSASYKANIIEHMIPDI